ncbi:DUF202 domain-containing protein [Streptococcaceae bacterium ESL0687]|nr:DUF202 domain-containing protein [Streptococcaceae bacterium ESL0687]
MNQDELISGYQNEINYQKHMMNNLGRWFSLLFVLASIGLLLIYFFRQSNIFLFLMGCILAIIGILGMLLFGYGIFKGRKNLNLLIDDFQEKITTNKG